VKILGRPGEAAAAYRQALALDAGLGGAARELAALDVIETPAGATAHGEPLAVSGNCGSE
jgi:hypothetical protein